MGDVGGEAVRPGAVEPADLLRAQLWCRACEEFCFASDAEHIAEFFREHLPHRIGQQMPEKL